MGAPVPGLEAADDSTAEGLLNALKNVTAAQRRRHATVFNYWLSIRGDKPFPPIRDLDPLEISDAAPSSVLLEMIGGGEDAEIRHFGQAINPGTDVLRVSEAPSPSLLSSIANKLPIVAATREAFAFEDRFAGADGTPTRCSVTLLPFSATGAWIDYVYGFVTLDPPLNGEAEETETLEAEASEALAEAIEAPEPQEAEQTADEPFEQPESALEALSEDAHIVPPQEAEPSVDEPAEEAMTDTPADEAPADEETAEGDPAGPDSAGRRSNRAGFSARFFESLASVGGFYGRTAEIETGAWEVEDIEPQAAEEKIAPADEIEPAAVEEEIAPAGEIEPEAVEPVADAAEATESVADPAEDGPIAEAADQAIFTSEGPLQSKLSEVRAKADEARMAKLRANSALYEGLSAAYDFALDAENEPEEYLRLVEAQGLKIQLRSPMQPVVKLAFDGLCDDATIGQLESVLAWALKQDLPRGTLGERIEAAGGIGPILGGQA